MKPSVWRWIIVTMLVIAVTTIGLIKCPRGRGVTAVSQREEIIAAESLLAGKLSGTGYFNAPVAGISEEGGPWISAAEARSQVSKIAAVRKFRAEGVREIERLIQQMIEPPPSRMVGGERINLLRLNLSLDELKNQ